MRILQSLVIDDNTGLWNETCDGVATSGTFVKSPDATWDVIGADGIPEGWTVETAAN